MTTVNNFTDKISNEEAAQLPAIEFGGAIRIVEHERDIAPACKGFKKAFINAHILERSGDDVSFNEGCLSIPGIHEDVVRKDRIKITYRDENWVEHTEVFEGTQARIVQHEYDHLDGVMFTDHLAPLKKSLLKRKLNHISAGKFNIDYRFVLPK